MHPVRILSVDLTSNEHVLEELPPTIASDYLGGRGWGTWLLLNRLAPEIDPLSPANILFFITGPLTGTPIPGSGKFVVVTKSPATGTFCDSYSSGKLAPALRFAGYDILQIVGQASSPSYLLIDDGRVEIRRAAELWGLDAFETEHRLRSIYGEHGVGIAVIGPAGENLVKFATIGSDYYRHAARGGVGAVMGSKKLKAIVIRGTGSIPIAQPDQLIKAQSRLVERARSSPKVQTKIKYGTTSSFDFTNAAGMLPTNNFQRGTFPQGRGRIDAEAVRSITVGHSGCYACIMPCGRLVEVESAGERLRLEGPEYETLAMLGANLGVSNIASIVRSNLACDKLGLDVISTGSVLGFLMECVERGKLSDFDLPEVNFGQEDITHLLEDIAYRREVGALLADGVRAAAERIGHGTEHFAMHVKGLELPAYDPRAEFGAGLVYAVTARGGCHRRAWPPRVTRFSGKSPFAFEGKAAVVKDLFDRRTILHSILVCDFHHRPLSVSLEEYAEFVTAVTGDIQSAEDFRESAERIETTARLFNVREGFSRHDDTLPPRLFIDALEDGPASGWTLNHEGLDLMLDEYYASRGWDCNGIPLPETLIHYGVHLEEWDEC